MHCVIYVAKHAHLLKCNHHHTRYLNGVSEDSCEVKKEGSSFVICRDFIQQRQYGGIVHVLYSSSEKVPSKHYESKHGDLCSPFDSKQTELLLPRTTCCICVFEVYAFVASNFDKEILVFEVVLAPRFNHVHLRRAVVQRTVDLREY